MLTESRLQEPAADEFYFQGIPPIGSSSADGTKEVTKSQRARADRQEWLSALLLVALDIVIWTLLYGAITELRGDAYFSTPFDFVVVLGLQLFVLAQAIYIIGGYDRKTDMRSLLYTAEHILAMLAALAVSALFIYAVTSFATSMKPSRSAFLLSFVIFTPISIFYRRAVDKATAAVTASRAFLVIGSGELAIDFYRAYRSSPNRQRLEFVEIEATRIGEHLCGPESPIVEGDLSTKLDRLGHSYSGVILAERVDRISPDLLQRLVRTQFQQTRVYTLESFYEAHWRHVPVSSLDPFWPLQMGFQLARNSPYHYLKRLADVVLASLLLVVGSWLLAIIVVAIWLETGRPILFRQTRVGREGELFTALKFRTMFYPARESELEGQKSEVRSQTADDGGQEPEIGTSPFDKEDIYTREGDPRITRIGRWLRKLRFDEIPQLINVLRGEMSLIGPRAEWNKCAERYEKKIPFYHFRHLVKPGITGWAQVNYPYGEGDADAIEKLKYDLYYIRHYSLKLDAMIVLKTVHTMLFGKGR